MAIEQKAQSILADVQKRNERLAADERARQRKAILIAGGLKLGAKIGNEILSQKAADFLRNEEMWMAAAHQKKAQQNMTQWSSINNAVVNSGKSAEQWFIDKHKPEFEAYLKDRLPDEKIGPGGAYGEYVSEQMKNFAKPFVDSYEAVREAASGVGTEEEFDKMVALNAKKAIPSDVGSWFGQSVVNMFKGKDADEIKSDALDAIKNSKLAKNAEAFNTLMDTFYQTNKLSTAFDNTKLIFPEFDPERHDAAERIVSEETEIKTFGDTPIMYTKVTKEDVNTGRKTVELKDIEGEKGISLKNFNEKTAELAALKAKTTALNLAKDTRTFMTPEAYTEYVREVTKAGLNVANIETTDDYDAIAKIASKYFGNDTKMQNEFIQEQALLFLKTATEGADIKALIANMAKDPEKKDDLMQEFITSLSLMLEASSNIRYQLQQQEG